MFCTYIVQFCCFRWFRFVILEAIYSLLCVIDFAHLGRPYGDILSVYYYVICLIVNSSIIGKLTYFVSHLFSWLVDNGEELLEAWGHWTCKCDNTGGAWRPIYIYSWFCFYDTKNNVQRGLDKRKSRYNLQLIKMGISPLRLTIR